MERAEDFQAYLHQLILEFKQMLKEGGADMRDMYGKVIESFYWACRVNKNIIIEGVDCEQVLQSVRDPKCKTWKLKLNGKKTVDPTSLVDDLPIGPQTASQIVSMKPEDVMELVEEEIATIKPEQKKMIKQTIQNICRSQALVHRYAADLGDHLASLCDMVSIPMMLKVMNATMRLVVAVKISEIDDMMAQVKVDAIHKAKEAMQGARLIDEVVFAQNCPTFNPEWQHSKEGKAMSYLASLVCRYMYELERKDKKQVLSARALEAIYKTASSSVGKLISGKHYLGGYALDQVRDKKEKEGAEIPKRKMKKLVTPLTSAMEH